MGQTSMGPGHTRFALVALGLLFSGGLPACVSMDAEVRDEHAAGFREQLEQQSSEYLDEYGAFSLQECVDVALQNSQEARTSEINSRIAELENQAAFGYFLPAVDLSYDFSDWDKQPATNFAGSSVSLFDKSVGNAALNVQLPIFVPSAWYLYAMRSRGEDIGILVEQYTRQRISLQVTALYFSVLELDGAGTALESAQEAAQGFAIEARALQEEGLIPEWQAKQAQALVMARQIALQRTRRAQATAKGELLTAMGLSPMVEIVLEAGQPLEDIDRPIADLITEALLHNPTLHVADRTIEIERAKVNSAVTSFLPNLLGFGSWIHTNNSHQKYKTNLTFGVSGVLSIFNGFTSVNEYKVARQAEEKSYLAREQATLSLMLQVLRAQRQLQTARELISLAQVSEEVAQGRLFEIDSQEAEGLVALPDKLAILAANDSAREDLIRARFQHQVAIATLMNVLGQGILDTNSNSSDPK